MKKIYESPVVELNGFSVEDVITTSVIDPTPVEVNTAAFVDAQAEADFVAAANAAGYNAKKYGNYTW